MQTRINRHILFFLLALVFSIALMFTFVMLPVWLDALMQERVGFPGMDQGIDETSGYLSDLYIEALYLRWIGYASLGIIALFIILGFVTKKSGWAWAGAITIFLPVFGQFALSMFFLAGLGILRTGWLPFMDISWNVLDLGKVIYIPYWILMGFFRLFGWYAHDFIAWAFMASGAFLFVLGVMEWFIARFGKNRVAINSIYKISRHPQYLGWILWSYGFMLFSMYINNMKKTWGMPSSFPWLLMTVIIIAICMLEELKMNDRHGERYMAYRRETPFLVPLPRWLSELTRLPARMLIRKKRPENNWDILKITGVYLLTLMLISAIWIDFSPGDDRVDQSTATEALAMDSLLAEINKPDQTRRDYDRHIKRIRQHGDAATEVLLKLLESPVAEVREFSAYALGNLGVEEATAPLINLLCDDNGRVRNAAIQSLGTIASPEATPHLITALNNPDYDGFRCSLYASLSKLGAVEAVPYLVAGINKPPWYQQNAALNALYEIDPDSCFPFIVKALTDDNFQVRRKAVFLLLRDKRPEALEPLRKVIDDEDFETRFYARQAIKMIENTSTEQP